METFSIELNINEANTILAALGQMPFARVHGLIRSIQEQATAQLHSEAALNAEAPAEEKEPVTV